MNKNSKIITTNTFMFFLKIIFSKEWCLHDLHAMSIDSHAFC